MVRLLDPEKPLAFLGGDSLMDRVEYDGTGFWLRLSDHERAILRALPRSQRWNLKERMFWFMIGNGPDSGRKLGCAKVRRPRHTSREGGGRPDPSRE